MHTLFLRRNSIRDHNYITSHRIKEIEYVRVDEWNAKYAR